MIKRYAYMRFSVIFGMCRDMGQDYRIDIKCDLFNKHLDQYVKTLI